LGEKFIPMRNDIGKPFRGDFLLEQCSGREVYPDEERYREALPGRLKKQEVTSNCGFLCFCIHNIEVKIDLEIFCA